MYFNILRRFCIVVTSAKATPTFILTGRVANKQCKHIVTCSIMQYSGESNMYDYTDWYCELTMYYGFSADPCAPMTNVCVYKDKV